MRADSPAPRNSRELAVRNQFFTPRYVVEFLTDNTLGRLWYEMTQGQTGLADQCRYLVRRPNEVFLQSGEEAPTQAEAQEERSQEALLQQPVYIPFRALKDPRDITMLDPACGSMHFGLYAFDLFEVIYDEAWEIAHSSDEAQKLSSSFVSFVSFVVQYFDKAAFLADVPRLIIEYNLHGIDIDPRSVQIAGLSLWLRAQRTWQQQGLRPQDRPRIRRSNIVCAEPMPGEEVFLEEFIGAHLAATPEHKLLGQLVRRVFDSMKLAGEAGSLLKIEEEIAGAVAEAKQKWLAGPKIEQGRLFANDRAPPAQQELGLDVTGITDETFWEQAEERIYAALQTYAEQVEHGGYQRRLFADDAARGFAFIDLCRKCYDVVLMNPPFGGPSKSSKSYIIDAFPLTKNDVYATFIERGIRLLDGSGLLGVIASRTGFFLSSFSSFREWLLSRLRLALIADLGNGVLDAAMVNTAAFIIENKCDSKTKAVVFNLLEAKDKDQLMLSLIRERLEQANFILPQSFRLLPGSPFAYWASPSILAIPEKTTRFEAKGREVRQGLATSDDFRFVRAQWEISPIAVGSRAIWMPFAKGGESAAFYSDIHLLILWHNNGEEIKRFAADRWGSSSRTIKSADRYFEPGLTYTSYTLLGFSPRVLPAGCVFSVAGMHIFLPNDDRWYCLGFLSSSFVSFFLSLITDGRKFEAGYIKLIPFLPEKLAGDLGQEIVCLTKTCYYTLRQRDTRNESSHVFFLPNSIYNDLYTYSRFQDFGEARASINSAVLSLFELTENEISTKSPILECSPTAVVDGDGLQDLPEDVSSQEESPLVGTKALLSWIVGVGLGRWDICFATGEKPAPELPDPFAPLPVCPPGQLQNEQGLPITREDVTRLQEEGRWHYPLEIPWDGILVDDPGHPMDLEARVHQVLHVIWKDRWEAIEREACEILGVRTLRDYFRKPAGFFADHLKRYSKSRRQAPIYWPLQTPSGSYTLWLYYHRLNDQTLYTCVNDFVEKSKLHEVTEQLHVLRTKTSRSKQEEKELERLLDLEQELKDFRDELLRVAKFWKPNLNDGVQITAAPLWKLFQYRPWQKTLKDTWDKLQDGDYEWAHLAYSIWPDRVRDKCKHDKSLAIAHGLEDLYEEPPAQARKKRGRKQR